MTRVIMEAFAALSPEQVQAVKDHEKAPGHMGQLRAVLKHRRGAATQLLVSVGGSCWPSTCIRTCYRRMTS